MLVLGITYWISALLQLLAGISTKLAFQSSHAGEDSDPEELVSTARDFESKAAEIPSSKRRAYMPRDDVLVAEYSRRFELSLSPIVFLLPTAPLLAAGFVTNAALVVLFLVLAVAAGAVLYVAIRRVKTPDIFSLGIVTFLSICLHLVLGAIFVILSVFAPAASDDAHGTAMVFGLA